MNGGYPTYTKAEVAKNPNAIDGKRGKTIRLPVCKNDEDVDKLVDANFYLQAMAFKAGRLAAKLANGLAPAVSSDASLKSTKAIQKIEATVVAEPARPTKKKRGIYSDAIDDSGYVLVNRDRCAYAATRKILGYDRSTWADQILDAGELEKCREETNRLYVDNRLARGERDAARDASFLRNIEHFAGHQPIGTAKGRDIWEV